MQLPEQVAVMTLPNAILFPRVLLPLYIFEERYKRMLADCLAGDRMFAVALGAPWTGKARRAQRPCAVAGLGLIRACMGCADGTSNLILDGVARVRIRDYKSSDPVAGYPVARIEPLTSVGPVEVTTREPLLKAVKLLARLRAKAGDELPKPMMKALLSVDDPGLFCDLVSYTLLDDWRDKQLMLETLVVGDRLDRLITILGKQTRRLEWAKTLQGHLPNDEVGHN